MEYFGTYLGYLPTITMSPHCDTFQLILFSTVEVVLFSLVPSLKLHSSFLETPRISHAHGLFCLNLVKITFLLEDKLINFYFNESL